MIDKPHDTNALLYRHFISQGEITRDRMYEYGVRDIEKKVEFINEGGRFYLEDIGDGFVIFVEEKGLPKDKYDVLGYNNSLRKQKPRSKEKVHQYRKSYKEKRKFIVKCIAEDLFK